MPYEYLEHVATADIAFRAWGEGLPQTFAACAEAVMNVMVEELDSIRASDKREIHLENDTLDMLLFDFLQELVYYKDAELLLLRARQVRVEEGDGSYQLWAEAWGERLDPKRHETRVDVKAVTLHRFSLNKTERGWEAIVVLDI
jgi:protein archease